MTSLSAALKANRFRSMKTDGTNKNITLLIGVNLKFSNKEDKDDK